MRLLSLFALGVIAPFAPPLPYGPGHRGVDFSAFPGQAVVSPITGQVSFVGVVNRVGTITISSSGRKVTLQPVLALANIGEEVKRGQLIARVSAAPYHCRNCLHLGVRINGHYANPISFSKSSLLPVGASTWIEDH